MLTKISNTAMIDLSKVAGVEIKPEGITVNVHGKDYIVTEPIEEIMRRIQDPGNDQMQWAGR